MSGGSGILDIERRVENAVIERLRGFTDVINLLKSGAASVMKKKDASVTAEYPSVYVEAYNFAEYGRHTGNYMGGIRFGAVTYRADDLNREIAKSILGGFRSFLQQVDLVSLLNGTVSAQTFGSLVWFFSVELDMFGSGGNAAFFEADEVATNRKWEAVQEVACVVAPSRP